MERRLHLSVEELKVVDPLKTRSCTFFISAKEALNARMHKAQGMPEEVVRLQNDFRQDYRTFPISNKSLRSVSHSQQGKQSLNSALSELKRYWIL